MDETSFFFRVDPRYAMLLPSEDPTIRDEIKLLNRVTLVVCCNRTRIENFPITTIGKAKEPT